MIRSELSLAVILLFFAAVVAAEDREAPTPQPDADSRSDAFAQGDAFAQEIDVQLAEIEVFVSNRQGETIAGLTREDFLVFQNGDAVELTHFRAVQTKVDSREVPSSATEPPAGPITLDPRVATTADDASGSGLHLVIYIDRGYLEPGDLRDVRPAVKEFLHLHLRPGDRVMLVTAAQSLELLQGFTSLPELVIAKLDEIKVRPGGGRLTREYQSILADMARVKNEGHDLLARDPTRGPRTFVSRIQAYVAEIDGEIRQTAALLRQLTASIAGLPGRRAVLYIGGRVPTAHGRRLFDAWQDAFGRTSSLQIASTPGGADTGVGGGGSATSSSSDTGLDALAAASASFDAGAHRYVQETAELASTHGVVVHTLDAAGLRDASFLAPGDTIMAARGSAGNPGAVTAAGSLADSMSSLRNLAWTTGGRDFTGGRSFDDALARVGRDLETFYVLGFRPLESDRESSKIDVRLRHNGSDAPTGKLKVRHRSHFQLKNRDTLAAERTVSALLLEEMENPLRVEVAIGEPTAEKSGAWQVPVEVTVPLSKLALVADGRVHSGRLSIYAASGRLDRVGSVTKAVVPVRIQNRDLLTSLGRRVAYQLDLALAPDTGSSFAIGQKIAVTVRDDFRPQSSTAIARVGLHELTDNVAQPAPGSR